MQAPAQRPAPLAAWAVPQGWKSETIPFPLPFAMAIEHQGVEELRFAPGFFDPESAGYWSYAFVWRTTDAAVLDAAAMGTELTAYYRGLIASVDDRPVKRVSALDQVIAKAEPDGPDRFKLTAHVVDAFKTGFPLDLVGWAERRACGPGALWIFVVAPPQSSLRPQLDALARAAQCGQPAL